jgi:hypothetical protein
MRDCGELPVFVLVGKPDVLHRQVTASLAVENMFGLFRALRDV